MKSGLSWCCVMFPNSITFQSFTLICFFLFFFLSSFRVYKFYFHFRVFVIVMHLKIDDLNDYEQKEKKDKMKIKLNKQESYIRHRTTLWYPSSQITASQCVSLYGRMAVIWSSLLCPKDESRRFFHEGLYRVSLTRKSSWGLLRLQHFAKNLHFANTGPFSSS